jgi:hypothetical protein
MGLGRPEIRLRHRAVKIAAGFPKFRVLPGFATLILTKLSSFLRGGASVTLPRWKSLYRDPSLSFPLGWGFRVATAVIFAEAVPRRERFQPACARAGRLRFFEFPGPTRDSIACPACSPPMGSLRLIANANDAHVRRSPDARPLAERLHRVDNDGINWLAITEAGRRALAE